MNQVLGHFSAKVAADCARRRFGRIGRPHHGTNDGEGVFWSFEHSDKRWAPTHESNQVTVERLFDVLSVMLGQGCFVEDPKLAGNELEAFALEPVEDVADVAALDRVRLADDERSV